MGESECVCVCGREERETEGYREINREKERKKNRGIRTTYSIPFLNQ